MDKLIDDILFCIAAGEIGGKKKRPSYLADAEKAVYDLLEPLQMNRREHDRYTDAVIDLMRAAEYWGFVSALSFAYALSAEIYYDSLTDSH